MRCIEIGGIRGKGYPAWRLIETWDVLKLETPSFKKRGISGLIETWDVLKFP